MTQASLQASLAVTVAAVVVGVLAVSATRDLRQTVATFLDFLLTASLLRLVAVETWAAVGTVALVALVRRVVAVELAARGPTKPGRSVADAAGP